jgi:poly(3-hydroxybutyrate) depolymerase
MLYQFYETQRSLMEPFSELAQTASKVFGNPLSLAGQNPFAQRISASYDLMHRLGKDYERPEFGLRTIDVDGVEVAIHERVEIDKPFCELRRFKRFCDDQATLDKIKGQPAVLIVAPLSGHYATLLRDTVKTMLRDHKVYITDWKNARLVPLSEGEFHLDDYVNYVQEFIRHVQGKYGNEQEPQLVREQRDLPRSRELPWSRSPRLPRLFAAHGFRRDESQQPCQEPLRLLQGPDQG